MPSLASINSNLLLSFKLVGRIPPISYTVSRIFTGSSTWVAPSGITSVEYLVVSGGGGGGYFGGGGGAGGLKTGSSLSVTPGQLYTLTVGSGGTFSTLS